MLERITHDWPLKLLALGLAFAIWVAITGEDRIPVNFDIALDPQLRDEHIFATSPPAQIKVRLVGPESVIRSINPLNLSMVLNLTDSPIGEREVQLTESDLTGIPQRVEVDFFEPDRVQFEVDVRQKRQLPIVPNLSGEVAEGYTLYQSRARPDMVLVEGPASAVSEMEAVGTDQIPLDDRTRRFIERVSAVPGRDSVRVVDPRPIEVRVEIDVAAVDRELEGIPVLIDTTQLDATSRVSSARVTLSGPPALVDRVLPEQIRLDADLTGLAASAEPQSAPLIPTLDLPPDQATRITVKSVYPAAIRVTLSERSDPS